MQPNKSPRFTPVLPLPSALACAAASFLLEHVGGGTVECRGNSEDRYEDAAKSREIVAERMTPAQIAEAKRLAKEWLVEHPEVR